MSAALSVVMSAVLFSQEPAANKPVHTRPPIDSLDTLSTATLDSLDQARRNIRCWRARPMPECRMVFLTDIGVDFPLHTTRTTNPRYRNAFPARLNWSIGLMRNGDRHSHGLSFGVTGETAGEFPGIVEYRYRYWLGPNSALDAGFGWKRHDVGQDDDLVQGNGMTFLAGFTPSRWFGANVRYEFLHAAGTTHRGLMLGVQSTRVSEYTFQFLGIAIRDWLLGLIGFEWEGEGEGE